MKLAYFLPLALAAAAFAETEVLELCDIALKEFMECTKTIPGDDGTCMKCLNEVSMKYDRPTHEDLENGVAACARSDAPCHGCAAQVAAIAECGKQAYKQSQEMGDKF